MSFTAFFKFSLSKLRHLFKQIKKSDKDLPLYKGGAIYQYQFNYNPSKANRYVNLESKKVQERKGFTFKNNLYRNYRLVIRDVARSTDERSLITAIVPKGSFITNVLHGIHIELNGSEFIKNSELVHKFGGI